MRSSHGTFELTRAESVDQLGPEWEPLFADAGLQMSRAWLAASTEAALPTEARPIFVCFSDAAGPAALFPMVSGQGGRWASLTTPYTCLYQPLLRPGADHLAICTAFARLCRQWPITRLEALDRDWFGLAPLAAGCRAAGLAVRHFDHFANWSEPVPGGTWSSYLAARPGALRETIRRKTRAAERAGARLEVVRDRAALPAALAAYESVYARSWKQTEPYPRFNATLVARLAPTGTLRIAVMWRGDSPVAAQYWTVCDRTATLLKLAHDETFKPLSPGTVLTAAAIRCILEADPVERLDFGRGDDPYKAAWTGLRRTRTGVLALDWRRAAGSEALLRHDAGRLTRWARAIAAKLAHIPPHQPVIKEDGA